MSKIFRNSEIKEIDNFLSNTDSITPKLKGLIQEELKDKTDKYKDSFIWLISRNDVLTIDVFNIKGDIIETDNYFYKDYIKL